MTTKLKLNIITTIKKEQLKIIDILENDYTQKSYSIDYEDELNAVDTETKELIALIEKKSKYFTQELKSEDEVLKLFDKFFTEINPIIERIISHYLFYKKSVVSDTERVPHNTSLLIVQNICNDYLHFLIKLEAAVLELNCKNVILKIDAKEVIEIIQYFQEKEKQSIFMPMLLSFGVGYLVGDM
ncbi:hypothetical protein [Sulfurimonas sp.]